MLVYELSINDLDASQLFFPIEGQEERLLELAENKITNGISVKDDWNDFIVLKNEPQIDTDFHDVKDAGIVILSPMAYMLISPLLDTSIETLKLRSDDGDYYLINVTETTDCLDRGNSVCRYVSEDQIIDYQELAFYSKKIKCPIFRIPELPYTTFITDKIMEIYYSNRLKGLNLSDNEFVWSEF